MRYFFLLSVLLLPAGCTYNSHESTKTGVLIKNARIFDGSGNEPFQADVFISEDRIALIGTYNGPEPGAIIDAAGLALTPGFIDLHAHGNPLGEHSDFENFITQGVTTICLGMDGFSAEDITGWLKRIAADTLSVNVVPFIGHSTIRELSGTGYAEFPVPRQIEAMQDLLSIALDLGYFGLTTGLEYLPGGLARNEELEALASVVSKYDKIIMSHIRNEDDDVIETSLKELINLGKFCPVHVSHIKVVYGKGPRRATEILSLIDSARQSGITITADMYPYTASYTGIGIVFPEWAKAPNDYSAVKASQRKELEEYLFNKVMQRNGPGATLLGTGPWKGMTLDEAAKAHSKSFTDLLIDDIGPEGVSAAYFIMDEKLQAGLLKDPFTAIASDGSPTMNHPRGYGSFAKFIRKYVREDSLFSLQQAVYKMTGLPAGILGLKDRGLIKAGYKADLVLFDPGLVKDNATYDNPHLTATGFRFVFINGELILEDGNSVKGRKSGRLLRR